MSPSTFNAAHYAVQKYKALKTVQKEAGRLHLTSPELKTSERAVRAAKNIFESAMEELCNAVAKD